MGKYAAIAKAEKQFEKNSREAMVQKLVAQERARWANEDAKHAAMVKAKKRSEIDKREETIRRPLEEEHARWAEEDAIAASIKKKAFDTREALVAQLMAEEI